VNKINKSISVTVKGCVSEMSELSDMLELILKKSAGFRGGNMCSFPNMKIIYLLKFMFYILMIKLTYKWNFFQKFVCNI
jgi:hypothetical protein